MKKYGFKCQPVLLGESASGKTTLLNMLISKNPKYHKVVAYTTRPMRESEVDGADYHFITQSKFDELDKDGFFLECSTYRGWSYGTAVEDCKSADNIMILTPKGLRRLQTLGIKTASIYLYVDSRSRIINAIARGDDIDEAYRRNLSDVGQFDGVVDEANFVIDNTGFHMNEEEVLECLEKILHVIQTEMEA